MMSTRADLEQLAEAVGEVDVLAGADRRAGRIGDALVGLHVLGRDRLLQPHQVERLQPLGDLLAGRRVVAAVHVGADVDVRPDRLARGGHLVDHALHFGRAGGPVVAIVFVGVVGLVEVELHRREAHVDGFSGALGEFPRGAATGPGRAPCPCRRGCGRGTCRPAAGRRAGREPCRPDPTSAVSTADNTATNMPACAPSKKPARRMSSKRRLTSSGFWPLNPAPEHLHQVIGAGRGVHALAAAPDALVRVDLHEQAVAAANIAAFDVRDFQIGRARGLLGVPDSLFEALPE